MSLWYVSVVGDAMALFDIIYIFAVPLVNLATGIMELTPNFANEFVNAYHGGNLYEIEDDEMF